MTTKKYLFTSTRLGFRNWTKTDYPKMIAISCSTEVMKFFPAPATEEQTIDFIERMKEQLKERNFCYFAVDLIETNEFIGFIGLCYQDFVSNYTPFTDIGWRLSPKFWGQGLATEGAQACLDYGFNTLLLKEIYSTAPKANTKSWHIMEKIGMKKVTEFIHPRLKGNKVLEKVVLYKISNLKYEQYLSTK